MTSPGAYADRLKPLPLEYDTGTVTHMLLTTVLVAISLVAAIVIYNWITLVINAQNRRLGVTRNVSMIFAAPQILAALTSVFLSAAHAPSPFLMTVWGVALADRSFWFLVRGGAVSVCRAVRRVVNRGIAS
jgi:hypothetical protein